MKTISRYDAEVLFNDMLDDCYPVIEIAGMHYNPSKVLAKCDPIAYNCMLNDFLDAENLELE